MRKPKSLLKQIRYEERIPTWALPYLINGDPLNGGEEEDESNVNLWFEKFEERRKARGEGAFITITPAQEPSQPYFTHSPAFGLACEVEDYLIVINYYPKRKEL